MSAVKEEELLPKNEGRRQKVIVDRAMTSKEQIVRQSARVTPLSHRVVLSVDR